MYFLGKYLLLLLASGAPISAEKDWWKYTSIYEIYLPSFKDSNGDGIGDLKGVTSTLDHLVDLGVETIWITPFLKSPLEFLGYDVENFMDIEPVYGTMDDFDELMTEMKKRGLKLLMDFVINHTSNKHEWFNQSINRVEPYTDFYVWKDAKSFDENGNPVPPNNWLGIYGGSAWTWNTKRKQFYYHQFVHEMPDLNLRNHTLKNKLKDILKYWFEKGVAGGRLDAARHFLEDLQLRDEPLIDPKKGQKDVIYYNDLDHIYTADINDTYVFMHELREFVDSEFSSKNGEKILIPEVSAADVYVMRYYGTPDYKIAHFPFNFHFLLLWDYPTVKEFDFRIQSWFKKMPAHGVANWSFQNHDFPRVENRFTEEYCEILLITITMLPGVACFYYGQEIGMRSNKIGAGKSQIPGSSYIHQWSIEDEQRLPMQWDNSMNAGFTSNSESWLPVHPDYWRVNVETQKRQPSSRYQLFKTLVKLRKMATLKFGDFKSYILSQWVYCFSRHIPDEPMVLVVLNIGTKTEVITLHNSVPHLSTSLFVLSASANSGYKRGQHIKTRSKFPQEIILRPVSGIVLATTNKRK